MTAVPIHILPPEVALRIAAGEVVTRPADVVKELVENAIDACLEVQRQAGAASPGSARIEMEIRGGGLGLIRVADTGCGIAPQEVGLAFQRHATSKIASADELFAIRTLGFRGEALASIAAVAHVTLRTRRLDDELGLEVVVADGCVVEERPWAGSAGTSILVRSLFQSVPARLRFLRNASSEAGQIAHLVGQYALAYPEIYFALVNDGRMILQSPGSGDLRDAVVSVYDLRMAEKLVPVEATSGKLRVHGYVSEPGTDRPTRSYLSFFVNRRWVQTRTLAYAVEQAYHPALPPGRHPIAILNLEMPPSEVDVNVHPAKAEVRFVNDRVVFSAVQRGVREAVLSSAPLPSVGSPLAPVGVDQGNGAPVIWQPRSRSPWEAGATGAGAQPHLRLVPDAQQAEQTASAERRLPVLHPLGQVQRTYIVAEGPDGVYFIDQHTAHERIRYEEIQAQWASGGVTSQQLLEPLLVELAARQGELISQHGDRLGTLGFTFEPFGERTYLVRAIPSVLRADEVSQAFAELVDSLGDDAPSEGIDPTAAVLACHSAVRAGDALTPVEMRELIYRLEGVDIWRYCPHGRPVVVRLDAAQLARDFRRH